jgi:predicted type IV restriction endonuclease
VAREAIEPALMRVISNDFVDRLRQGLQRTLDNTPKDEDLLSGTKATKTDPPNTGTAPNASIAQEELSARKNIITTEEEIEFYTVVRDICAKEGIDSSLILYKDTVNYFNVSYRKPTLWFIRFFGDAKRKCITVSVPVEEVKTLAQGFDVEESPAVWGTSRIYIENVAQLWALKAVIARSLQMLLSSKEDPTTV